MKQRDAPCIGLSEDMLRRQEVNNLASFEIMYDDLTLKAQIRLCETFNTHPVMENWETQPLAVVCRENE
jgi:hypothetical protein